MPTIARLGAFDIMMFRNDHEPAHFHVIGPEFSAKFTISDLVLLSCKGRIRRRDIREIEGWGQLHRDALHRNWSLARTGKPMEKIVE